MTMPLLSPSLLFQQSKSESASDTTSCHTLADHEDIAISYSNKSSKSFTTPPPSPKDKSLLHGEKRIGRSRSTILALLASSVGLLTLLPILLAVNVTKEHQQERVLENSFVAGSKKRVRTAQEYDSHVYDVLIVGSGWSGLGAADTLRKAGIENFQVLEARDSVGGRSRTVYPFANDLAVEMGSAWTYEDTEVHNMMLDLEIPHGKIHYDQAETLGLYQSGKFASKEDGVTVQEGEITGRERRKLLDGLWWDDFVPFSKNQREELRDSGKDKSFKRVLDEFLRINGLQAENLKERQFLQAMVHAQIEIEYASPLQDVSAQKVGSSVNECLFCDADYYVPVQGGGFDKILRPLAEPLGDKIQLNRVVNKIEYYDGQPARVTYTIGNDRTKQYTKLAKTVLVTVPLGVLKAKSIEFIPPLPQAKQYAIDYVGFGVLNKCVFYWESPQHWWPEGKEVLTLVTDRDSTSGTWTTFFNDRQLGNGGHYVLSAWTGGDDAMALEGLSDKATVAQVLQNLRAMLGEHVPPPSKFVISRWGKDEFARGSYSFSPIGKESLTDSARRELGARVGTSLFWAGEATAEDWSGTTVGAYRSGITAAEDILLTLGKGLPASVLR